MDKRKRRYPSTTNSFNVRRRSKMASQSRAARTALARQKAVEARKRRIAAARHRELVINEKKKKSRRKKIAVYGGLLLGILLLLGIQEILRKEIPQVDFLVEALEPPKDSYSINETCESYRETVTEMARDYDMEDYVDLILAVMMQESAGQMVDIMQSSEGQFNTRYPREPDGITDTQYSIECGILELKHALREVNCSGPEDIQDIEIALQAYNFGTGYLHYMEEEGLDQWSVRSAQSYAKKVCGGRKRSESDPLRKTAGIWDYGDQYYPEHVLRYYPEA